MMRRLFVTVLLGAILLVPTVARSQNLLVNGGLEFETDTFALSVPDGWKMSEGPPVPRFPAPYQGDYNDGGVSNVPCPASGYCGAVDAADYTVWRDHLSAAFQLPNEGSGISTGNVTQSDYVFWKNNFGTPYSLSMAEPADTSFPQAIFEGDWNMWFQPYYGTFAELPEALDNFAHLYQDVAGTPGVTYTMKGWAAFEPYFAGARANLNLEGSSATPPDDGPPSPTKAIFALEFLDAGGDVLPGSIEVDLRTDGQVISSPGASFLTYSQHTLSAVAPAGTVDVRVRASMLDGVLNPGVDPQSYFVDAFELTASGGAASAVPEPASLALISVAITAALLWRRRQ
ncbi:MAG: PEP-CTERM sorting domain-containing protein [Pirellulales bacterium]